MTVIHVPQRFRHTGDLSAREASVDPRIDRLPDRFLQIDMRGCEFILPPAVLWCAIYALLARQRGDKVELLVPSNLGVSVYLQSVGLFKTLKEADVDVDDRDVRGNRATQVALPLTRFTSTTDVERLANESLETLNRSGFSAVNLNATVSEIFAELALNAVQHAESEIGAFGLIQFYELQSGKRFICAVGDGGIGIRKSLEQNPKLRDRVPYDWVAIDLALRERVSGTGDATRGIGLYGVAEDMRSAGRQLIINSGIGILEISEQVETRSRRTTLFPGTLASASVPS